MHIDHDNLTLQTESDVEQKVIMPLLVGNIYLAIAESKIFTKKYLAPTELDKKAGRSSGYYPDYTAWMSGFPVLVVEAKAPDVPAETGYREAALYAGHLNRSYPTNINPSRFVIATNGKKLLFGYWDSMPVIEIDVAELRVGSAQLEALRQNCRATVLESHADDCLQRIKKGDLSYPYDLAGGSALLNAKLAVNTFAARSEERRVGKECSSRRSPY